MKAGKLAIWPWLSCQYNAPGPYIFRMVIFYLIWNMHSDWFKDWKNNRKADIGKLLYRIRYSELIKPCHNQCNRIKLPIGILCNQRNYITLDNYLITSEKDVEQGKCVLMPFSIFSLSQCQNVTVRPPELLIFFFSILLVY